MVPPSAQGAAAGTDETYGSHAGALRPSASASVEDTLASQRGVVAHTLFAWSDPVSPHLAVATEGAVRGRSIKVFTEFGRLFAQKVFMSF